MGGADGQALSRARANADWYVIDGAGRWIAFEPTLPDYLKQVGGPTMVDCYRRNEYSAGLQDWAQMTLEERRARRALQPAWWAFPSQNALDRATAMLPSLLYERRTDIGLDFAVVYPTLALLFPAMKDPEVRSAAYRAYNLRAAEHLHAALTEEKMKELN